MILVGHVIDQLRTLADASVHLCVTSPPYWGLRAYGTEPQVWGGDPACVHAWQDRAYRLEDHGDDGTTGATLEGSRQHQGQTRIGTVTAGRCARCGAWRGELGAEEVPDCLGWATGAACGQCYVCHLVMVFSEVRRVLRADGALWLNLGDSYNNRVVSRRSSHQSGFAASDDLSRSWRDLRADGRARMASSAAGLKEKDLCMMPARVALALQADGWYLRADVIWAKPAGMPESVADRPTKAHEYLYLLAKSPRYYYDQEAIREPIATGTVARLAQNNGHPVHNGERGRAYPGAPQTLDINRAAPVGGRNRRSVWTVATVPYPGAHYAVFPPKLIEPCILAGTSERGCCPTCGAPWARIVERTPMVIRRSGRGAAIGDHGRTAASGTMEQPATTVTVGWRPGCTCNREGIAYDPIPCTVLDPFLGSGTTGMVCNRLGRRWIGIELNPAYAQQARGRTAQQGFAAAREEAV